MGKGNPYHCCISCGRTDPHIAGRLDKHESYCEYRQRKEQEIETGKKIYTLEQKAEKYDELKHMVEKLLTCRTEPAAEDVMDSLREMINEEIETTTKT